MQFQKKALPYFWKPCQILQHRMGLCTFYSLTANSTLTIKIISYKNLAKLLSKWQYTIYNQRTIKWWLFSFLFSTFFNTASSAAPQIPCTVSQDAGIEPWTNEKRGGLKVVAFDRSPFKVFSLRFSKKSVQAPSCERPKTTQRTLFLFLSFEINNWFPITV